MMSYYVAMMSFFSFQTSADSLSLSVLKQPVVIYSLRPKLSVALGFRATSLNSICTKIRATFVSPKKNY
jgi:hypothetical protein